MVSPEPIPNYWVGVECGVPGTLSEDYQALEVLSIIKYGVPGTRNKYGVPGTKPEVLSIIKYGVPGTPWSMVKIVWPLSYSVARVLVATDAERVIQQAGGHADLRD